LVKTKDIVESNADSGSVGLAGNLYRQSNNSHADGSNNKVKNQFKPYLEAKQEIIWPL